MEYLQNISGDNTPAALVATYGCREYEDALLELKTEVESRGFKVIGAAAFPAEHSIVPTIGARRPNKTDLKTIAEFGVDLNRRIRKEESFDHINLQVPGSTPYKKYEKMHFPESRFQYVHTLRRLCKSLSGRCDPGKRAEKDRYKEMYRLHEMRRVCKQNARSVNSLKMKVAEGKLRKVCQSDKKAEIFL